MGGGQSGGGNQTVTQVQQIPQFEQDFAQNNMALAQSLAAQPYAQYHGQLQAPQNDMQMAGMAQAGNAANSYQPMLNAAQGVTGQTYQNQQPIFNQAQNMVGQATQGQQPLFNAASGLVGQATQNQQPLFNAASGLVGQSMYGQQPLFNASAGATMGAMGINQADPRQVGSYMSPYVMNALQPQIMALQTQLDQQQQGINRQATQANAYGDARQGAQSALANYFGNQALTGLVGQGYNTAFQNAQQAMAQQQQAGFQGAGQLGNLASQQAGLGLQGAGQLSNIATQQAGVGLQGAGQLNNIATQQAGLGLQGAGQLGSLASQQGNLGLQTGNQLANIAGQQQGLGIAGANALYNAGSQLQNQQQTGLNLAYQQFQNQTQHPYQMLNVLESVLANNPYNVVNQTTLPQANGTASSLGAFGSLAGGLGSLLSGGSSGANAPLGGTAFR